MKNYKTALKGIIGENLILKALLNHILNPTPANY